MKTRDTRFSGDGGLNPAVRRGLGSLPDDPQVSKVLGHSRV